MINLEQLKRISVTNNSSQANGQSGAISLSNDAVFVPIESNATNLLSGDSNNFTDIFLFNTSTNNVQLISTAPDGSAANGPSSSANISGNGRYITYSSSASNLVSNDNNNQRDLFIHDRETNNTNLVSVATNGSQANNLSLSSFVSDTGRYVVFDSLASNLVNNDINQQIDIFVRDRINQATSRINLGANAAQANGASVLGGISEDGLSIVFSSDANNLVGNDTNSSQDIFLYNQTDQSSSRINLSNNQNQGNGNSSNPVISGNGSFIAYQSDAANLVAGDTNNASDIFLYNAAEQTTQLISVGLDDSPANGNSSNPTISDDGLFVAFLSDASNLVANDNNNRADIFIRDLTNQTTTKVDADSFPVLSGNAESLIFTSSLSSLVNNDTNDTGDVFLQEFSVSSEPEPPNPEPPNPEPPNPEPPNPEPPNSDRFTTDEVHRFFHFERGFHLYTADDNEINVIRQQSEAGELAYNYEGETFSVPINNTDALTGETIEGVSPVYRFFNTVTGAHLYTSNENERSFVQENLDNYNFEGIQYYAFDAPINEVETIPVFRLLNTISGSHLYTTDPNELNFIQENLPHFSLENNGDAVYYVFELE